MTRYTAMQTTKTTKTTIQIELQREEVTTAIVCSHCERKGEIRQVFITPPSSIGSSVIWCSIPDGWWTQSGSPFNVKATCPSCFATPPKGVLAVTPEDE